MHWTFKVIFIVVWYAISFSCHPLFPNSEKLHSEQKRFNPVHSYNSSQKLSRKASDISSGNLHHRNPLRNSDNRLKGSSVNNLGRISLNKSYNKNELKRRGLDVGIRLKIPTAQPQQYDSDLEKLEAMLANALANRLGEKNCSNCEEEEEIIKRIIQPAYECDEWEPKSRVCTLERNIGDTVTFYLSTGKDEGMHQSNITWKKEFHIRDSNERKEFTIDHQNPPENIIIGKKGFELRISPITETDVAYNMFSATLQSHPTFKSKLYFMIRIVAIDLGFVYVGETVELNLRNFVSLPEQSMSFKWYMEKDGEHGTLPSNMKVSVTGSSIKISELRQEQEGILACSVYTNLQILATKKRFLLKDLSKNTDVLQSSPNHTLIFKEELRKKRDPKQFHPGFLNSPRLPRQKRARLAVDEVERALLQPTLTGEEIPNSTIARYRYKGYNSYTESPHDVPQAFETDNDDRFKEIGDNVDDIENFPENRKVDMSVNQEPSSVKKQRNLKSPQQINEELFLEAGVPVDEINTPDGRPIMNQVDNIQMNAAGAFLKEPEQEFISKNQQYIVNKIPPENVPNQMQSGSFLDTSESPVYGQQQQQNIPQSVNEKQRGQYVELDTQSKGPKTNQQDSGIELNIGGMKETRKITAEMQIAKLISYCVNEFECSAFATCEKSSLKTPGFCKCAPGQNGVGIFCREEVWLSHDKIDIQDHNLKYTTYPDTSPPS